MKLSAAGRYGLLTVAAVVSLAPLLWMMVSSLKPGGDIIARPFSFDPGQLTLHNFRAMLDTIPIETGFRNTAIVVLIKGALTMIFCPMAGFAFAKYNFPGKRLLFGTVLTTLMLPTLVLLIPLLLEMSQLGWVSTFQALILPGAIDAFGVFWMRQVIMSIPDELLDAARVDGAGELRIFASIVVPVIRPRISSCCEPASSWVIFSFFTRLPSCASVTCRAFSRPVSTNSCFTSLRTTGIPAEATT